MPLPPPAVNSAVFAHHAPNADPTAGDAVSQAVVSAGKALEQAYTSITAAHAAHMANPMLPRQGNLKRSADYSDKVVRAMSAGLNANATAIDAELAALDTQVNAPLALPKEPGTHYSATAQQIRDYFRSLPADERLSRATKAAQEGDTVTLGALLNAPGYLSGMDHVGSKTGISQQGLLADTYRSVHHRAALDRLAKLRKCREMITVGTNTLMQHVDRLHPHADLASAVTLDKAAKDASALAERYL